MTKQQTGQCSRWIVFLSQIQVKHEDIKVVPPQLRHSKTVGRGGRDVMGLWAQGLVQCYTMTQIHQDTRWKINIGDDR